MHNHADNNSRDTKTAERPVRTGCAGTCCRQEAPRREEKASCCGGSCQVIEDWDAKE